MTVATPGPADPQSRTEQELDAALEATFPASDPLSITQPGGNRRARVRTNTLPAHGWPSNQPDKGRMPS